MFSTPEDFERADWPLLQNGAVNLFWRKALFEAAKRELTALGYEIASIAYAEARQFREAVSKALKWSHFGYEFWNGNLDALNDGFRSIEFNGARSFAFCIEDFERLVGDDPELAGELLDIIERASRDHLLESCRLIALIQTGDPMYESGDIGAGQANWNTKEWLFSDRNLA